MNTNASPKSFEESGLSDPLLKALETLGFESPSTIQEEALHPLINEDKDLIGLAQTGTGKTAAFGLPLLQRIDQSDRSTQALILAPTRELCRQTGEQLKELNKYQEKVNFLTVYGGASISEQIKSLRKPQHILIATPGRLIDLIQRKAVDLESLKWLVLDEADEMLDMGFKDELDQILSHTPSDKQTWLFSATMPPPIRKIVKKYMQDPIEVHGKNKNEVNEDIEHQYALVKQSDRAEALTRFLDMEPDMRALVFCRTRRDTRELARGLAKKGYSADALSGDLSQGQRDQVMERFRSNELQLLVATDVAARGIDVNDLTHVFQFDLPDEIAFYTHRSGRTARAGKKGTSIVLLDNRDKGKLKQAEKSLGIRFQPISIPSGKDILQKRVDHWADRIRNKSKTDSDPKLIEKAMERFQDLSKEELIENLLGEELQKIGTDGQKDLNQPAEAPKKAKKQFGKGGKKPFPKANDGSGKGKKGKRPRKPRSEAKPSKADQRN